ncbi:pectinesterase family protein [Microbacterium sp.]|uniref:pectinesterase family protein n=1 Tax=Microbacterium sp. TaxID=51671 RepID=UPI00289B2860|nr:pectinesterase family protein [Microbacterium sp.]
MSKIVTVGKEAHQIPSLSLALEDPEATEIVLHPGAYVEHVVIAPRRAPLLVRGATGAAADVVVSFGLRQGDRDRTGMEYVQDCASLTIDADDVTIRDITIENTFDKPNFGHLPNSQALALRTRGDRILLERCRLLGHQDTVLLDAPSWAARRRVHLRDCEITGDVDFIYGRATALIEGGLIRSIGGGYIAAPSTARENPRGFLFWGVEIVGDLPAGSVKLGRPWHPGGKPDAIGQALFAHCTLGPHVDAEPWDDMGGYSWRDARFAEFANAGPGAAGADRPQLDTEPDRAAWLTDDGPAGGSSTRIFIASDSTASEYPADRAPRTGWGQMLSDVVDAEVVNLAVSGASTTSYIAEGTLDALLAEVRTGDIVLIGFGHNDPKPDERHADVFTAFPGNLRRFLIGVRTRSAVPVLLTPIERRFFEGGRAAPTHGGYPESIRLLARTEGVALIDLTRATHRLWQAQGETESTRSFLWVRPDEFPAYPAGESDDTHLSADGAALVAGIVAEQLATLGLTSARAQEERLTVSR